MTLSCALCLPSSEKDLIFSNAALRVVWVHEPAYPCFIRVIWNGHVSEMTDLSSTERTMLMTVVFAVEAAMRQILNPDKINHASFGNRVPHVHWHVIPRWQDDSHWPEPIWSRPQRVGLARGANLKRALSSAIALALK